MSVFLKDYNVSTNEIVYAIVENEILSLELGEFLETYYNPEVNTPKGILSSLQIDEENDKYFVSLWRNQTKHVLFQTKIKTDAKEFFYSKLMIPNFDNAPDFFYTLAEAQEQLNIIDK